MVDKPTMPRDAENKAVPLLPFGFGQTPVALIATGTGNNIVSGSAIAAYVIWVYCDTDGLRIAGGTNPDARAPGTGTGKKLQAGLWQFPWDPSWKIALCGGSGSIEAWPAFDIAT